ncbi:hypothetical protein L1887_10667 [Cichorium endivia]|nr:hypothetical protein L1887_10667 [Cichorium endivia]
MNSESKRKFHQYVEVDEVMQLKKRVAHLEEETNTMMQEMTRNTAERKTLLKDVYRQLKLIQFSSRPGNQSLEYKFYEEGGRADGLCQVLYEDLNPSVVIRGGSLPRSVVAPGHVERRMSDILCIEYNN